jgi:hypothetical protein
MLTLDINNVLLYKIHIRTWNGRETKKRVQLFTKHKFYIRIPFFCARQHEIGTCELLVVIKIRSDEKESVETRSKSNLTLENGYYEKLTLF